MYGGSTTSILVNIPGEAATVITCIDGYQMARKGRAGPALGISAFGSFIAGTVSIIGLMIAAPPLARFALDFGPPEYSSLIFLAFSVLIYMASGSMLKAVMMIAAGIFVGCIGTDYINGDPRFIYGSLTLFDGVGMIPVVIGMFGVAEVLENTENGSQGTDILYAKLSGIFPTLQDWKDSVGPIFRGTLIGFFLGLLPGGGPLIASFAAYAVEKKISKHPNDFGKGAIEGVAGPEAANNAATGGCFIPLMTLGIPTNIVMALMLGALMIHGIRPGPMLIKEQPNLFWGVVTSMYIGNFMLLVLNIPLIGLWVRLLSVPYRILFPLILLFCVIGVYSLNNNIWEIIIMVIFGVLGYLMRKFGYEAAPFVFALILGPMMETAVRQSLRMSEGSFAIFFSRPISCILLIVGFIVYSIPMVPWVKRKEHSDQF
jgi:putative tricarboxylic transport membrane protein